MAASGAPDPLRALLTPEAVRDRAERLFALAEADRLDHFRLVPERLDEAAELVAALTRESYPDLNVPLHSRWRHLEIAGPDPWSGTGLDGEAPARAQVELAIVSVLLDAGAGAGWRYRDETTGLELARSEGLAVASLRMFRAGGFSGDPRAAPLRADRRGLEAVTAESLGRHFQVRGDNPLVGLEGRARLLNALGRAIPAEARLGFIYDLLAARSRDLSGRLPAREILLVILECFNAIWPSGLWLGRRALGDVGRHRQLKTGDASDGLVPFHKLSQWLAYSLIEPLQATGIAVGGLDGLTGLAEYRNGGLFLDTGVLRPRDPAILERPHEPDSECVVEWRALTVALLDRLAVAVRVRLSKNAAELPLAAILQGGSWAAGRRLAEARRGGLPPLTVASDGTVF